MFERVQCLCLTVFDVAFWTGSVYIEAIKVRIKHVSANTTSNSRLILIMPTLFRKKLCIKFITCKFES